ncbi:MAG: hypothetical protein ACTHNN_17900 [Xanthobacteraceae bacterium]
MTATAPRSKPVKTTPLTGVLLASLEALAATGEADAACRLAGQACAELRHSDPAAWRRFNVFLHRMIKHVS